jgi:hypothetical protein
LARFNPDNREAVELLIQKLNSETFAETDELLRRGYRLYEDLKSMLL